MRFGFSSTVSANRIRQRVFGTLLSVIVFLLQSGTPGHASAQTVPNEIYGPFNAIFLPDGSGLSKRLGAPQPLDTEATTELDRLGRSEQPDQPAGLLQGWSTWTIAFWFHAAEPMTGEVLLAGLGDPESQDARFVGFKDNHLGLWLGKSTYKMILSQDALSDAAWHFALATGDGQRCLLYADGKLVAQSGLVQGAISAQLVMAPAPLDGITSRHFGGEVASLRIFRETLTAAQMKAIFLSPPDFKLPTFEEASRRWPVQTAGMAGQVEPQDPSTLPHGKAEVQKPIARPLRASDIRTTLAGDNPWRIEGGWKLAAAPDVKAAASQISLPEFDDKDWLNATVPGTVLTTLIDRGIYPDPDYGLNNMAIPESLAHQDYWYRVRFKAPPSSRNKRMTLTLEGVNYAAEVWLNGRRLGSFTGAFLRGKFDVTHVLTEGQNALAVRVSPQPHPGIANEESIRGGPGENGGVGVLDGPTFAASEGWDWIPGIRDRNTGIWQDVTLTASGDVEVGDLNVVTVLPKEDRSEADIEIEAPLTNNSATTIEGDVTATFDNVHISKHLQLAPGETIVRLAPNEFAQLRVQNPTLWWPNGYGDPVLHDLDVSFMASGRQSGTQHIKFGMREVSYETSLFDSTGHLRRVEVLPSRTHDAALPLINETHEGIREIDDRTPNLTIESRQISEAMRHTWVQSIEPGAENSPSLRPVSGNWTGTDLVIKVNGVRIAARGGNWGMDDSRKRVSVEHLEPYFRLHRDAHINMIRDWMGQDSEENFYALADKYGLMVWNDFWDSTQNYNLEAQDPALFLKNAKDSILHFRHHPSIVVWCGRNEGVPQPIINEGLANLVRTFDHTRYYTGSSNRVNLRDSGPYRYQTADTYYRINRGFSVELGIPSVPTLEAMQSFIPLPDQWPISDTWAYHDWHQSGNGSVAPFIEHLETEFGAATSLEDFERKAQMLDYSGYRAIFEGFAAHLWEPNSGRMIWMTQPAWPSMEWNIFSSDYDTQSSFYGTQKACEPVHAQLDLTNGAVDLINLGAATSLKVESRVIGLDGKVLSDDVHDVAAAANARTGVSTLELEKLAGGHTVLIALTVTDASGDLLSRNVYWWAKEEASLRELNDLPPVKLIENASFEKRSRADAEADKITVSLRNTSSEPALMIKLILKDSKTGERILPAFYSENYISLMPGEETRITISFLAEGRKPVIGLRGWNLAAETTGVE